MQDNEGTGTGLAICHRIVDQYGGPIGVASIPAALTTFTLRLPASKGTTKTSTMIQIPQQLDILMAGDGEDERTFEVLASAEKELGAYLFPLVSQSPLESTMSLAISECQSVWNAN